MHTLRRLLVVTVVGGLGLAIATILLGTQVRAFFVDGVGGGDVDVNLQPLATRSVVYARDGTELFQLHAEENRVPVSIDRVPPHLIQAVLDAEDERYWDHGALDVRGIGRALVANVEGGGVFEGGSTITQQLVKTSLLDPEQSLSRKVKEAILAIRLESQMSKREILEHYLNTVYFGNGAYGVQAAAERYFATDVENLTLGHSVLLAGLIRNPTKVDPFIAPAEARARRDLVIDRMHVLGHIPPGEVAVLKAEPLPTRPPDAPAQGSDYFTEKVKQELLNDSRMGATWQDRYQAVFKGGLAIHTTLDANLQRIAQEKVADILPESNGLFNAALVSVEPSTGAVRALVGGANFDTQKFNLVTDGPGRQTGSTAKVFTLTAALENGYLPTDSISGVAPCRIPNPGGTPDPWEPDNVEGQAGGTMTLADATVHSVNCAYARLVKLLGPEKVVDVARRMGVTNPLSPVLAITLGSEGVTPLQMASAFSTLAADGVHYAPYFVERVVDRSGRVVFEANKEGEQVVSEQVARTVNQVLTGVTTRGTGRAANVPRWPVAGKTGSTDDNTDAWFVGYTRTLATAVWMGDPREKTPMTNVGGIRVYGGTYPARIFGAFMREALAGQAPEPFTPPDRSTARAAKMLLLEGERPPAPRPVQEVPQQQIPVDTVPPFVIVVPSRPPVVVDPRVQEPIVIPRPTLPPRVQAILDSIPE